MWVPQKDPCVGRMNKHKEKSLVSKQYASFSLHMMQNVRIASYEIQNVRISSHQARHEDSLRYDMCARGIAHFN